MTEDIYSTFGVKRRINAAGTLTRLGGALMARETVEAMAAASRYSVDIAELQAAASKVISRITHAGAGFVTTGASAALTLATAASMTRWNVARMAQLPHAEGFRHEVILPRTHYTAYAHAFRVAGARIVDIGHNDRGTGAGVRGLERWEIEAAITEKTAAFAFAANPVSIADLPLVVEVCKAQDIPVIVDAAAQLPPRHNLHCLIDLGADMVAFSGGKAIGGPQASGILAGRRDLIGAALVQQLDMDVLPETWTPPDIIDVKAMAGVPHHGLGRGFKAGKEEIVGLLTALTRFATSDDEAINRLLETRLATMATSLDGIPGISKRIVPASEGGRVPRLHLAIDASVIGADAIQCSRLLQAEPIPVHVSERYAKSGVLIVDPQALRPEDDGVVINALKKLGTLAGKTSAK